jgi:hypothetical protein
MAWCIIVHSWTKQVIKPSLYFAINCSREYELQISVSFSHKYRSLVLHIIPVLTHYFAIRSLEPVALHITLPGHKLMEKCLQVQYKAMSTHYHDNPLHTNERSLSKECSSPVYFPCDVGILSIQEPHGLQMYTASVLWLHPIPAQLNELDLIIPPPTHHCLCSLLQNHK